MATQKPISTISYNTEAFLKEKLDSWHSAHIIQAYMYICHKGEDGDKDHIHLRVEPNKKLDQMELTEGLKEYLQGEEKPRGVRPWRPSKEEDWFLYAVHDRDYMRLKYAEDKGEKLPYDWKQIVASDSYDVETAFIRARATLAHSSASIANRIKQGENPLNMALEGQNPITLNHIMKLVSDNEFPKLVAQYDELKAYADELEHAIFEAGFEAVEGLEGRLQLKQMSRDKLKKLERLRNGDFDPFADLK